MANEEHLAILKQGVGVWNKWREENPFLEPDLSGASLRNSSLKRANLRKCDLVRADLTRANLRDADLSGAELGEARLVGTNLDRANLSRATLGGANLNGASLTGTDFSGAVLGWTIFATVDLRAAKGLDNVRHLTYSSIDVLTMYYSLGEIPEVFLRGCGIPDTMIAYIRSLVASTQPIQYYSVFISYSARNEDFAERLHSDLQHKGVRCWFAPEDLKIGDRLRPAIDTSIRLHDKLLLVLSEHSVNSQWVEEEVETALARERKEGRTVLFPIRLDDAVMEIDTGWPQYLKNTRNIGNFTRWKDHDSYQKALSRLLRDLKQSETTQT